MSKRFFPDLISEGAEDFLEGLEDDRQLSAALAIHMAWLRYSSPIAKGERWVPATPVDMRLLYRAAAATFEEWPPRRQALELPHDGRVLHRDEAERRIRSLADEKITNLAIRFARKAIAFSVEASVEQDLDYLVELCLRAIQDSSLEAIVTGAVSKREKIPVDLDAIALDYW